METITLFELLEGGDVIYQDQNKGVVISRLKGVPNVVFRMWKHKGDGNFSMLKEMSRDDLFISWIDNTLNE